MGSGANRIPLICIQPRAFDLLPAKARELTSNKDFGQKTDKLFRVSIPITCYETKLKLKVNKFDLLIHGDIIFINN